MLNEEKLNEFIIENYIDITDQFDDENHLSGFCNNCNKIVGFQIIDRYTSKSKRHTGLYSHYNELDDFDPPYSIYFRCPICKLYKIWVVFSRSLKEERPDDQGEIKVHSEEHIFRVTSLPNEGIEEIPELPDKPESLKRAYKEAVRSMDANCYLAATAMFRRALQIITRDILGANPDTLANELKSLAGVTNKLGVRLTNDFSENSYIIKECGNQGAHPDKDPDLLDFEPEDAKNLYNIFLEIVSELFVAPAAAKRAKKGLLSKRKLT